MRKRLIPLMMTIVIAIVFTACGADSKLTSNTTQIDSDLKTLLIKQSEVIAEDMAGGNFDTTVDKFADSIKKQLTKDQLAQGWEMTVQSAGEFQKIYETTASENDKGITVISTIKYEKGAIKLTISYDNEQKISGVWIAPTDIAEEQSSDKFKETSIKIGKDPLLLDGMLTQPISQSSKAVVILVHGSGQSGMNEAVGENKPFQDIAHGLAEQGISTIRYNKRYFQYPDKAMDGDITIEKEVLEDVQYAIDFASSNELLKNYKIYIAGHSMGGMLAPKITLDSKEVAGFISLAGSPRLLIDIMYDQNMALIESMDNTKEDKDALIASVDEQYKLAKAVKSDSPPSTVFGMPSPYVYSLNSIDTPTIVKQLDIPMLFLQGSADFQVYADVDFKQWQTLLEGNNKAEFKLYDGLNHLFFKSQGKTDSSEYDGENHVEQIVIDDIANWIKSSK